MVDIFSSYWSVIFKKKNRIVLKTVFVLCGFFKFLLVPKLEKDFILYWMLGETITVCGKAVITS